MADSRAKELIEQAERMFGAAGDRNSLWQELACQFYPERADFVENRTYADYFAGDLFGSFPPLARRELANLFASMLRPRAINWFGLHVANERLDEDKTARAYLEHMDGIQRRAMYDPVAHFVPVTRTADHDFATFGNTVIEVGQRSTRDALLYKNHHLRDCVYSENADGEVDTFYRRDQWTARQLVQKFPSKVSADVRQAAEKDPEKKFAICQAVVPERSYRMDSKGGRRTRPFTVLWLEKDSATVLEETGEDWFRMVVPRWELLNGTPYALSPATAIALADSRTFQVVIRTLREAGEMAVNPPMAMVFDAFRGDAEFYPGGATGIDIEMATDMGGVEKMFSPIYKGAAHGDLRPAFEIAAALRDDIRLGFYLDKVKLPDIDSKPMTAYEFQYRLKEHIRQSAPLFEPVADEYNAKLCEVTFRILQSVGAFGPKEDVPDVLAGQPVEFKMRSPLYEVEGQAKSGLFMHALQTVIIPAMQLDPAQAAQIDLNKAVRDSLQGMELPADWLGDLKKVAQAQSALAQKAQMEAGITALGAGGQAAESIGKGMQSLTGQAA